MNLRERHKQERCGQIVAAAEQLLRSRGMDGFNMRQLAQDAGLSLATPYNLFGSKAEILLALLNRAVDDMERMVAELPSDDPIDLAFALVDASVAIYTRDADYYRSVLLTLNRVTEKRGTRFIERCVDIMERAMAAAAERDLFLSQINPQAIARQIFLSYLGCLELWIYSQIDDATLLAQTRHGVTLCLMAAGNDKLRSRLYPALVQLQRGIS